MLRKHLLSITLVTEIVAVTIVVLAYVGVFAPRRAVPDAGIPDESDIESVTASLSKSELGFKETPEFAVPPQDVPGILRWLRPSTYIHSPPLTASFIVGKVTIKTKQGATIRITFYSAGHNPPLFTANGADYFWGDGIPTDNGFPVDGGVRMGKAIAQAHKNVTR